MPNSAATSVAALPLLSQSSTACCLKVLSNLFRVFLVSITGAFIQVLSFDVFLYLCPFFRAGPVMLAVNPLKISGDCMFPEKVPKQKNRKQKKGNIWQQPQHSLETSVFIQASAATRTMTSII